MSLLSVVSLSPRLRGLEFVVVWEEFFECKVAVEGETLLNDCLLFNVFCQCGMQYVCRCLGRCMSTENRLRATTLEWPELLLFEVDRVPGFF